MAIFVEGNASNVQGVFLFLDERWDDRLQDPPRLRTGLSGG